MGGPHLQADEIRQNNKQANQRIKQDFETYLKNIKDLPEKASTATAALILQQVSTFTIALQNIYY